LRAVPEVLGTDPIDVLGPVVVDRNATVFDERKEGGFVDFAPLLRLSLGHCLWRAIADFMRARRLAVVFGCFWVHAWEEWKCRHGGLARIKISQHWTCVYQKIVKKKQKSDLKY
jgi:hypothetical protein